MWEVTSSWKIAHGNLPVAERGGSGQAGQRWRWPGPPGPALRVTLGHREPRPQCSGPATPPLWAPGFPLAHRMLCVLFIKSCHISSRRIVPVLSHFVPTTTLKHFTESDEQCHLPALTLGFLICTNRPDEIAQQGREFSEPMDGGGVLGRPSAGCP